MTTIKKILLAMGLVRVAIQFVQPAHNKSAQILPADLAKVYAVPNNVRSILIHACYDCHGNVTRYPWYSNIQPVAWFMAGHIKRKGKTQF